jgi:hypothetical protein
MRAQRLPAIKNEKEKATMSITVRIFFTSLILGGLLVNSLPCPFAMEAPEEVELAALSNIYEPVVFDHAMHMYMTSCAACHHHTVGMPAEDGRCVRCHATSAQADDAACTGCHAAGNGRAGQLKEAAADLFHSEATGLKRAYHLQCLGCHKEMEAASGCEDCHPKKESSSKVSQGDDILKITSTR